MSQIAKTFGASALMVLLLTGCNEYAPTPAERATAVAEALAQANKATVAAQVAQSYAEEAERTAEVAQAYAEELAQKVERLETMVSYQLPLRLTRGFR